MERLILQVNLLADADIKVLEHLSTINLFCFTRLLHNYFDYDNNKA